MRVDLDRLKLDLETARISCSQVQMALGGSPFLIVAAEAVDAVVDEDGRVSLETVGFLQPLDWTALAIIGRAVDEGPG